MNKICKKVCIFKYLLSFTFEIWNFPVEAIRSQWNSFYIDKQTILYSLLITKHLNSQRTNYQIVFNALFKMWQRIVVIRIYILKYDIWVEKIFILLCMEHKLVTEQLDKLLCNLCNCTFIFYLDLDFFLPNWKVFDELIRSIKKWSHV